MKYALLMYANESDAPKDAEAYQAAAKEWQAFATEAKATGAMLNESGGLSPVANATTVRVRKEKTLTADGPFAETHEQLGGVFLFECKDLDEAVCWAAKIPTAKYGSIEIRPLWSQG